MTTFVTNGQANDTGTIQTYTIATSGYYDILSMGAQGRNGPVFLDRPLIMFPG
jgi:hypothetical protein